MKKKGYSKGGMKKKGFSKGGSLKMSAGGSSKLPPTQSGNAISNRDVAFLKKMLADKESGKSVSDADKKKIEAMKRKGGGSAMKKKGYAKGGSAKKMHLGGAAVPASAGAARGTMVPASQTVSGAGLNPPQPAAQQQLDILSNSFSANKGAYTPTSEPMRQMPAASSLSPMQGDVGVGDFMNNQNPQRLDINLGQAPRATPQPLAQAPAPLSPFKPALGKIGAMKKGGSVAKRKKGGSVVRRKGGGSILNKKGYAKGGATRIF